MSTTYDSVKVKCPFYNDETKNKIKCEGAVSKNCEQNFQTALQKKKHKEKFCDRDYCSCPHYKQVNAKYK